MWKSSFLSYFTGESGENRGGMSGFEAYLLNVGNKANFHNLVQEMSFSESQIHFRYFRMLKETFNDLLSLVRTDNV